MFKIEQINKHLISEKIRPLLLDKVQSIDCKNWAYRSRRRKNQVAPMGFGLKKKKD